MPEPIRRGQRYMPGLDGLRAIAVLAVLAYHLEFSWAGGGLLGVGVFFTLSGYLITDLLLAAQQHGGIRLGQFWLGRARRLLPALFLMLAVVVGWVVLFGPAQPAQFREAVGAAALYVANWQLVFQHVSYFARFGPPSPLGHLWSLGVEEQFYILWPLLLIAGMRLVREHSSVSDARPPTGARPPVRPRLAALTLLLAGASALEMALLYHPSLDPSRVYYGTDTRAFELLAGAALAMVWPSATLRAEITPGARRVLDGVGLLGLLVILTMFWRTGEYSSFLYEGGFVLLSAACVLLLAALAHPASRIGVAMGVRPLRWIGERSYGIYLWHMPIIALTTPADAHGASLPRAMLQVAATFCVAALSWRFVEQPVRHGALGRLWRRMADAGWRPHALPRRSWAAVAGVLALLVLVVVGMAGVGLQADTAGDLSAGQGTASRVGAAGQGKDAGLSEPQVPADPVAPQRSSCHAVIHIGDSTSEGLISHDYLPDPKQRIEAQYARVGATVQHYEISGARSIVERYKGQPNAYEIAQRWKRRGYHGCWVLALGTNDAADVAVGSSVGMAERITEMMKLIGNEPVMWVNVKSLLSSGPYAEQYMRSWNEALVQACGKYPNMHVFDWASLVRNSWFISDGIHFNTPGYAARARLIAQALAYSFPAQPEESGCVVR
ncbi:MAG: acyltransferase family protein [Solirubrobacteraceae bacterium]